jgi:hypothetical protein
MTDHGYCELCGESYLTENLTTCRRCGNDFCYRCGDSGGAQCSRCEKASRNATEPSDPGSEARDTGGLRDGEPGRER